MTLKGKPLTFRPLRLDDEVFAKCQRLGKLHGTINEGLRMKLFGGNTINVTVPPLQDGDLLVVPGQKQIIRRSRQAWKRGPRPKGDSRR